MKQGKLKRTQMREPLFSIVDKKKILEEKYLRGGEHHDIELKRVSVANRNDQNHLENTELHRNVSKL